MSRGKNARKKGHDLERTRARFWRALDFPYCRTSRAESRLMDDCGIDITNIPFFFQCKAGYENNAPKYEVEFNNIRHNLGENFPADHEYHNIPIILEWKRDRSGPKHPEKWTWTMDYITAENIMTDYYKMKQLLEKNGIEYETNY